MVGCYAILWRIRRRRRKDNDEEVGILFQTRLKQSGWFVEFCVILITPTLLIFPICVRRKFQHLSWMAHKSSEGADGENIVSVLQWAMFKHK